MTTQPPESNISTSKTPESDAPESDSPDPFELELRAALAAFDPPPPRLIAAAHAAWEWRSIDEQIAQLVHDSSVVGTANVRGAATAARDVQFASVDGTIDAELTPDTSGTFTIVGMVGGDITAVTLWSLHHARTVGEIDSVGVFRFGSVQRGMARFEFTTPAGPARTEWFRV
jgi:hypothetical protein